MEHRHEAGRRACRVGVSLRPARPDPADGLPRLPTLAAATEQNPLLHGLLYQRRPGARQAPGADGHLIRFLADQQGCLYWYLYVTATGHAVVSSTDFYGGPQDDYAEGGEIDFCGESFESFLYRFWLENKIWYAANEDDPMPEDAEEYIRRYQANAAAGDH